MTTRMTMTVATTMTLKTTTTTMTTRKIPLNISDFWRISSNNVSVRALEMPPILVFCSRPAHFCCSNHIIKECMKGSNFPPRSKNRWQMDDERLLLEIGLSVKNLFLGRNGDTAFCIFTNSLFKEVGFPLKGDGGHPVEGVS